MLWLECPPSRRVSALLFGNRHKLELLAALARADAGGVNLSVLAEEQRVPSSVYYAPVRDLLAAGLVRRRERSPRDRRRWYCRTDHRFWDSVSPLVNGLAEVRVEAS